MYLSHCYDITEILLKVALNTINHIPLTRIDLIVLNVFIIFCQIFVRNPTLSKCKLHILPVILSTFIVEILYSMQYVM